MTVINSLGRFSMFRLLRVLRFGLARNLNAPRQPRSLRQLKELRRKYEELGFCAPVRSTLIEIAEQTCNPERRAQAHLYLARMALDGTMAHWSEADSTTRLALEEAARSIAMIAMQDDALPPDMQRRLKLLTVALALRLHPNAEAGTAQAQVSRMAADIMASADHGHTPEALLLCMAHETTPEDRLKWLNRALGAQGLASMRLDHQIAGPARTQLVAEPKTPPAFPRRKALRVSVMIPLCRPEDTQPEALFATLRSLMHQDHRPHEILLLNASGAPLPDLTADQFDLLRELPLPSDTGVFAAATLGLAHARGQAVVLLRAGDLALPHWLARAVQALVEVPARLGVLPTRAQITDDLRATLPAATDTPAPPDSLSALLHLRTVQHVFGGWENLPLGADEDLLTRIRASCGDKVIHPLTGGPDLLADATLTALPEACLPDRTLHRPLLRQLHDAAPDGLAQANPQAIPLPLSRVATGTPKDITHFDVVLASDFRLRGGNNMSNAQELACQRAHGIRTGVLPMYRYDFHDIDRPLQPEIRAEIDGERVILLGSGVEVSCDLLVIRYPSVLWYPQRFLPRIRARAIRVIVNQPPMSDYGSEARRRYHMADCAQVLRAQFGLGAVWHPIGPLVRAALHQHHEDELAHIDLSPVDWHNIIDLSGWDVPARARRQGDKLRIGRHSRDSPHKWPDTAEDILAAYPEDNDIEIHVLGGASTAEGILGRKPDNWIVHEFGAKHPRDFLADVDIWIYFAHPDWVESFGRTIIEAMAAGVPVILPEQYRVLFGDAALYATPQTAVQMARRLHADPAAYAAHVARARALVEERFSYEAHIRRLVSENVV
ncbi:MAG: hypothetical protein EA386_00190 [Rhodobacteraceae bacterium]|nr:MAG: hypothetical protein EA386_00190 [Paracoccaceae bacterium]